jgi:cyclophilin family peptidyl-prolyl cis-trans isomerase/HEAT repeat protein
MRTSSLTLACLIAACSTVPPSQVPAPAPTDLVASPAMLEIARLEDQRGRADVALLPYLDDRRAAVRTRAALALGRLLPEPDGGRVSNALVRVAAEDPDVGARCAALFALGQRAEPACGEALLGLTHDAEPRVRARAVEALAKLERPQLRGAVLAALEDDDPRVRLEAAHGPHRWAREEAGAEEVDRRLAGRLEHEDDHDVTVYALHSLERRRAQAGREAFMRYAGSSDDELRLFAVRGLKALPPDGLLLAELVGALDDPDWRVACEAAVGLGAYDAPSATKALGEAARKGPRAHIRRSAWEAIAQQVERTGTLEQARELQRRLRPYLLERADFEREPSLSVRAAYQEVELPLQCKLHGLDQGWTDGQVQELLLRLDGVAQREPPVVLAGLARALARIPEPFAADMLAALARHPDPLVAGAAIEALGSHPSPRTHALLLDLLRQPDNGLRLAALLALGDMARPDDLPRLRELVETTRGEVGAEVRFNAVRVAQALSAGEPSPVAELALADPDPYVRRVAGEVYAELDREPPAVAIPPAPPSHVPLAGEDYPLYARNPQVELETVRGTMVFELFPAEAPVHVHSFLELARRGVFDGLRFHRVVPDFVIQGGDPRGDGNGGASWRGDALRHEIGPRKYVRGALGMPRNADPDSGGGQLFVTHRRTPHLDGRYTIFGELVGGSEVLDAIDVGDRILAVRVP